MDLGERLESLKKSGNRVIVINDEKSDIYKDYCKKNGIELIDLSLKLADLLSGLTDDEKGHEAWDKLSNDLKKLGRDVLALYNVDYMFSPEVGNLDPIENFNYYSRGNQMIILFIRAKKDVNHLIYSEEGLPDYNRMDTRKNQYVLGWEDED